MNEVDILRKIASAASREEAPRVDVRARVLVALADREDNVGRPLVWVAAFSSALAAPMAIFGLLTLDSWIIPTGELMCLFNWIYL